MEFTCSGILFLIAAAGYSSMHSTARGNRSRFENRGFAGLSVLGGFATGALQVWLLASFIRFACLLPWANNASIGGFLLGPLSLFWVEPVVLLVFLFLEMQTLGGSYSGAQEWKHSVNDGRAQAASLVAVSTIVFMVAWWFICPPDYGKFYGSFVDPLVGQSAAAFFSVAEDEIITATEAREIAAIEDARAIPAAAVLSHLWIAFLLVCVCGFLYVSAAVNDDNYRHDLPEEKPTVIGIHKFNPRGGGVN